MQQIPDAPWIRDAEQNGMPSPDPVECPECGKECETVYLDPSGYCIGCDRCLRAKDSWEWMEEKRQAEIDDFMEHNRTEE